jgi:phage protein D
VPLGEEFSSTLIVEVDGQPLPPEIAALFASAYVDDSRTVPDLFVLRFSDERSTVIEKGRFRIGAKVSLKVQSTAPGGPAELLGGEVTALEAEVGPDGSHVVVRGLDASHRLFRGHRVEGYRNVSASDLVRKVAQRAGLKAGTIDNFPTVLTHVTQDGISDWDFLSRLATQCGAVLSVAGGALDFRKPTPASTAPSGQAGAREDPLTIEKGTNLITIRATVTSAGQVPEVEVRGWDVAAKKELVAVAPAATTSAKLGGTDPKQLAATFSSPKYVRPALQFGSQSQCEAAASALADRLAGGFVELEGTVRGNPRMRAGAAVALTGLGATFDGQYTLSATRHEFTPSGYVTSFTVAGASERSLYGAVAGGLDRPGTVSGVLNATVTDARDPDGLGRVKVRFPVVSGAYESWWARTVQQGAGKGRGAVVLPEVGDEVLVAFGQGSFEQPYVLGGLFNGVDKPDKPWSEHVGSTDGAVVRRAFGSRTGMLVEHLEAPDKQQLNVSTNGGAQRISLVQKPNAAVEVVTDGPVTVKAGKDVTVSTSGGDVSISGKNVTIEASANLTLKATSAAELSGATVKAKGSGSTEVSGASVKVAANAAGELTAGGVLTVRGSLVKIN